MQQKIRFINTWKIGCETFLYMMFDIVICVEKWIDINEMNRYKHILENFKLI